MKCVQWCTVYVVLIIIIKYLGFVLWHRKVDCFVETINPNTFTNHVMNRHNKVSMLANGMSVRKKMIAHSSFFVGTRERCYWRGRKYKKRAFCKVWASHPTSRSTISLKRNVHEVDNTDIAKDWFENYGTGMKLDPAFIPGKNKRCLHRWSHPLGY